ncbi:MAG: hypothetical protein PHH73_01990 [Candidatus Rickettsiella isopodorum]|nr:hypothetical protein [Candidatus Rickettsiella isopodorum]
MNKQAELEQIIDELVLLVQILATVLKGFDSENEQSKRAIKYLKDNKLVGLKRDVPENNIPVHIRKMDDFLDGRSGD